MILQPIDRRQTDAALNGKMDLGESRGLSTPPQAVRMCMNLTHTHIIKRIAEAKGGNLRSVEDFFGLFKNPNKNRAFLHRIAPPFCSPKTSS